MELRTNRSESGHARYDAGWTALLHPAPDDDHPGRACGRQVRYKQRALILAEGDEASAVYEVIEGGVILFKLLPDGRRQIIEVLGVGDVFGLAASSVSDVAAEALTPVRLARFERSTFEGNSRLRDRLFARLRAQFCALHDHALLLGRKSAQERVTTFIARMVPGCFGLDDTPPKPGGDPIRVDLAMSRQEIADYLGLTIETVSRTFSALRRSGVIAYRKQDEVEIPNIRRLFRMTGSE